MSQPEGRKNESHDSMVFDVDKMVCCTNVRRSGFSNDCYLHQSSTRSLAYKIPGPTFMLNTLTRAVRATMPLQNLPLGSSDPSHALLLVFAQPGLLGLSQHPLAQVIDKVADHDEHKRDRVQEVHMIAKNPQPDDHAPEIDGQQTDVEEGGRSKPIQYRNQAIEQRQNKRVSRQIAANLCVPHSSAESSAVEDAGLGPVDDHPPPPKLANDLIERTLADQELLGHVTQPVGGRAHQREQIALELAARRDVPAVGAGDVVGGEEDAHARDANEDANDLGPVVADAEEKEGDGYDDDDRPEVDQLGGENGGVAVGEDGEVVALDVAEGEDDVCRGSQGQLAGSLDHVAVTEVLTVCASNRMDIHRRYWEEKKVWEVQSGSREWEERQLTLPTVLPNQLNPTLGSVLVHSVRSIDHIKQNVVEKRLERRDRSPLYHQQSRQSVRAGEAKGQELAEQQDHPEVFGREVSKACLPEPGSSTHVGGTAHGGAVAVQNFGGAMDRRDVAGPRC